MKPDEVVSFAKEHGCRMVDMKFTDLIGSWQHFTIPIYELTPEVFEDGLGFDGSSIRGWRNIEESDMTVIPDPSTAKMDPFCEVPTLSLICDVVLPDTGAPYNRDPRQIAKLAIAYMKSTGLADTVNLVLNQNFLFLMMFAITNHLMVVFTKWIPTKPHGILAETKVEVI